MTAYVLYDNIFNQAGATVTFTHEVDNSGAFAHDNLLFDRWIHGQGSGGPRMSVSLGAAYEIDCWSIFGHNLGTSGTRVSLYSDDGFTSTLLDKFSPTDDSPIFRRITPTTEVGFFLLFNFTSADDQIYHAAIGKALQLKPLNTGFRPPMFEQFSAKNSVNNHGVLLGRSVSKATRDLNIRQNAITTAELYSDYKGWLDHAARWPFMFCWNYEDYPGDSVFCWLDDTAPEPVYSNLCHLSIDMRVKAMLWKSVPET